MKASKVVGADICEVDLVEGPEGKKHVLEVNINSNVITWSNITGIDLSKRIAEFVADRAEKGIGHRLIHISLFIGRELKRIPKRLIFKK